MSIVVEVKDCKVTLRPGFNAGTWDYSTGIFNAMTILCRTWLASIKQMMDLIIQVSAAPYVLKVSQESL